MTIVDDDRMPALFVGHGSPMNAIEKNAYTEALGSLRGALPLPRAILVVSAHWQTSGVRVLSGDKPRTIHDFGGFPPELYKIQYPAGGFRALVDRVQELLPEASEDDSWGYDHGTWSVLRHLFPDADVPVVQLSLDRRRTLTEHLLLARRLAPLRREGVMILGSGNVTHNLRDIDFSETSGIRSWAMEFDEMVKMALETREESLLLKQVSDKDSLWKVAHPTLEHYLPLLYVYGVAEPDERPSYPYTGFQASSISMRTVRYG